MAVQVDRGDERLVGADAAEVARDPLEDDFDEALTEQEWDALYGRRVGWVA